MKNELDLNEELQAYVVEMEGELRETRQRLAEVSKNLANANRELINKDIHMGRLSTDRVKAVGETKQLRAELERIHEHYIDRRLFTDKVDKLVAILHKMRKTSDNTEDRKMLQEFIEVLSKAHEHQKKA